MCVIVRGRDCQKVGGGMSDMQTNAPPERVEYRVAHLVANLGWVDLDFECSTVCKKNLLVLMGTWHKGLGKWVEHRNSSQQNPGPLPDRPPWTLIFQFNKFIVLVKRQM